MECTSLCSALGSAILILQSDSPAQQAASNKGGSQHCVACSALAHMVPEEVSPPAGHLAPQLITCQCENCPPQQAATNKTFPDTPELSPCAPGAGEGVLPRRALGPAMAWPPSRLVLGTGTEVAGISCNPAAVGPGSAEEAPPIPAAGVPVSLKPGTGEGPLEAVPRLPTALPGAVPPAAVGTDGARPMGACCLRRGAATAGPAPLPMP